MRIKKILLSGFKSYFAQEKFDDFHPNANVIVGKNGAGKSNLIVALRFLLSSEFQKLRIEDRKELIHQGPSQTIVSGFVEIYFDNTDKRFPVDTTEVRLRRNIGLSKADYYLNGRHISAEDVMNLLESAGFSRSNPYYIVQQGKVQALSRMKPAERLELLREVAGTSVYDERKTESLKIMKETETRKQKVLEVLKFLDDRLGELEKEKKELTDYQEADKSRRVLEYTIYTKELTDTNKRIDNLDESHMKDIEKVGDLHKKTREDHEKLKKKEKKAKTVAANLVKLNQEKEFIQQGREAYDKTRARLELILQSSSSSLSEDASTRESKRANLRAIEDQIAKSNKILESLEPRFAKAKEEEQNKSNSLQESERRLQDLYSKQGRAAQFSTAKERDAWIKKELDSMNKNIASHNEQVDNLQAEVQRLTKAATNEKTVITKQNEIIEEHKTGQSKILEDYNKLKDKRDELNERRKELWHQEANLEHENAQHKEALGKAEHQLYSNMPKDLAQGLRAVKRIAKEYGIKGVYGPVIDLFTLRAQISFTAIEVAAKGALFNVVVDTDRTASRVLELLNEQQAGRVTFMPLNKLAVMEPTYPGTETATPMVNLLVFENVHRKAFLHIFGKTLLCKTLEEAGAISRTQNMDCITPDGDKVNRKGVLSGGYYEPRKSKLSMMAAIKQIKEKLAANEKDHEKLKTTIGDLASQIDRILDEIQAADQKRTQARDIFEMAYQTVASAQKKVLSLESQKRDKEKLINDTKASIRQMEETRKALTAEVGTKLVSTLSAAEEAEIRRLQAEVTKTKKELLEKSNERAELEANKNVENLKLTNHLLPRKHELDKELDTLMLTQDEVNLDRVRTELDAVKKLISKSDEDYNNKEKEISENLEKQVSLRERIDSAKEVQGDNTKSLQEETKGIEKLLNTRNLLLQKRDNVQSKLRDIGSLPTKIQQDFQGLAMNELVDKLQKVKQQLRAFGNVNKKALDQYVHFKDQREDLEQRKKDLDEGEKSINKLIEALDEKKDEAIERTFKMVAKFFKEVFAELTNGGTAQLVMQNKPTPETAQTATSVQQYKGVDIKVSFTSSGKEQRIHQLSGGQQSVVALALIFAIQRCDPAPFYVFDEIDAALDDTHRMAVAKMVQQQSKQSNIQFILTSHRPELVNIADKHYLIEYKNKVSQILSCHRDDALKVVGADARGDDEGPDEGEGPEEGEEEEGGEPEEGEEGEEGAPEAEGEGEGALPPLVVQQQAAEMTDEGEDEPEPELFD